MPVTYPYTQYTGIWKLNAASAAQGAGTWPSPPVPHLLSWGYNGSGQLGLGNTTNYSSPKQVGSLTNWLSISSGYGYYSLATKTDGTLWAWGDNSNGQLGLGNTTTYSSPKQVGALTNWLQVSCGYRQVGAIKTDGTLWMWGQNNFGQIGNGGSGSNYSSPVQIGALTNWATVACGVYDTGAIKTDGTLWMWGRNNTGQLGRNNIIDYSSPKQVGALTNWLSISAGYKFYVAIKTDGTLWAWGYNGSGQLGLGNGTAYSSPKQIGSLTTWAKNSCGWYHSAAIKTDNTLWTWGLGSNGQLGLGNITSYSSPMQVGALTNWLYLFGGYRSTFSIKTDGTAWGVGYNNGVLGIGSTTQQSSFVQIGSLTTWQTFSKSMGGTTLAIAKT